MTERKHAERTERLNNGDYVNRRTAELNQLSDESEVCRNAVEQIVLRNVCQPPLRLKDYWSRTKNIVSSR
ncbi:hypothetical protein GcC1_134012 [Golovinomyces cichoracearum]|uniref:Uncharacterized protein n=1 Tax=Golovinomyces cichoracearum TaxID=62708 RepID=A0A420I2X8_9PEZI|nr:hypothetical protein GcC1_134012 [Golovinomyces cichoracearum]